MSPAVIGEARFWIWVPVNRFSTGSAAAVPGGLEPHYVHSSRPSESAGKRPPAGQMFAGRPEFGRGLLL